MKLFSTYALVVCSIGVLLCSCSSGRAYKQARLKSVQELYRFQSTVSSSSFSADTATFLELAQERGLHGLSMADSADDRQKGKDVEKFKMTPEQIEAWQRDRSECLAAVGENMEDVKKLEDLINKRDERIDSRNNTRTVIAIAIGAAGAVTGGLGALTTAVTLEALAWIGVTSSALSAGMAAWNLEVDKKNKAEFEKTPHSIHNIGDLEADGKRLKNSLQLDFANPPTSQTELDNYNKLKVEVKLFSAGVLKMVQSVKK